MHTPFDPEALLHALWQKHVRVTRRAMAEELGTLIVKQAASGFCLDVGTPLDVRWAVEWRHLEATIKDTLAEFDQRAEPGAATASFLRGDAASLLAKWSGQEARSQRSRDGTRTAESERNRSGVNLERLLLHLESVAATEASVLASSFKFVSAGASPAMLTFDREVHVSEALPEEYQSIVRGEALKRGLTATIVEQTGPGLLLQLCASEPSIANSTSMAQLAVDDFLSNLAAALAQGRQRRPPGGDTYIVHQAGAVGPNARAEHVLNQYVSQLEQVELARLADELAALRAELRRSAQTPEQDEALGAVASAERAARSGDRPGAATALSRAGLWVCEKASALGLELLKDILSKKAGL